MASETNNYAHLACISARLLRCTNGHIEFHYAPIGAPWIRAEILRHIGIIICLRDPIIKKYSTLSKEKKGTDCPLFLFFL